MSSNDKYKRRQILEKGLTVSAVASLGFAGTIPASATGTSDDVEALLRSTEVKAIRRADSGLEIRTSEAVLIATGSGPGTKSVLRDRSGRPAGMAVPTNHGTLTVVTLDGDQTAILDFDQQVPAFEADWPDGTTARLKATDEGAIFQRSATTKEANRILRGIERPDLVQSNNVEVSVAPEEDAFYILHVNDAAKELERIRGKRRDIGASRTVEREEVETGRHRFQVFERETHSVGDDSVSLASTCDCDKAMADVIFCVYQAVGCISCFIGSPVPPVLIACLILVCAGGTGGIFLSLLGNLGCLPPSSRVSEGCVTDCIDVWV